MKALDTYQLYDILSQDPHVGPHFGGVYPRDRLPSGSTRRSFVVNTDTSDRPGEHWVCVHFGEDGVAEYFDSYGLPPWAYGDIVRFMRSRSKQIYYNTTRYQSDETKVCGHYCTYYLKQRNLGVSRRALDRGLWTPYRSAQTTQENDRFVYRWFQKRYLSRRPRRFHFPRQTCVRRKKDDRVRASNYV